MCKDEISLEELEEACNPGPFSTDEVKQHLEVTDDSEYGADRSPLNWRGRMLGLECWGGYVRLEAGWYSIGANDRNDFLYRAMLYHTVLSHGSRAERSRWKQANIQAQNSGPDYEQGNACCPEDYPMPITDNEMAEYQATRGKELDEFAEEMFAMMFPEEQGV